MAHPVAKGTVEFTARTVCHATRYMAHTARMVEQPIGVRTLTAIKAIPAIAKFVWDSPGTTQSLRFAGQFHQNAPRTAGEMPR